MSNGDDTGEGPKKRLRDRNPADAGVFLIKWGGLLVLSWFVAAALGDPFIMVGVILVGIALMKQGLHPWLRLIAGGGGFFLIIWVSVWPILSTFIAGGLPTFQFSLFEMFGLSSDTFDMLRNPEYYIFQSMNPTQFERTTDSDAPNIALTIDNLEASPGTNCFGNQFIVTYTVENEGDNPLVVGTGLRTPILTPMQTYPCPCEILKTNDNAIYAGLTTSECISHDPSNSWFWSDDWADQVKCSDFMSFAQCEGVLALKQFGGTRYTWYGALTGSGIYSISDYAAPLGASSCGYFGPQEMRRGVPYQKVCQGVVYYPASDELKTEACQIEAYAAFTDWSSAVLPIQFVDTDYYVMRDLEPYTQPSITSTGGAALSISAGQQPLLDSYGIISLTAGISNAGAGDMTNIHMMYLFIPKDLTLDPSGSPTANNACTSDVWSCGGSGNCDVQVAHCGICGCPANHICSSSNLAECESISTTPGTCSDSACSCGDNIVYDDQCAASGSCTCYSLTGSSVDASSCNILDTLLGTTQSSEFTSQCNALANDYHVCVLTPEEIADYTLYNCPVNIENSVELGDNDLRKSYIARLDAFYDYELKSSLSVTGVECG